MTNLKQASEAYKVIQRLKKKVDIDCLTIAEKLSVNSALKTLEQVFEPYEAHYRLKIEEEKRREEEIQKICSEEGHIGEWSEETYDIKVEPSLFDQYVPLIQTRWSRTCERCGKQEITEVEPKEVKKAKKEKEIQELEEKLKKMKAEF